MVPCAASACPLRLDQQARLLAGEAISVMRTRLQVSRLVMVAMVILYLTAPVQAELETTTDCSTNCQNCDVFGRKTLFEVSVSAVFWKSGGQRSEMGP